MSVQLSQTIEARFVEADAPGAVGAGLRVLLAEGGDGASICHAWAEAVTTLHSRVMLRAVSGSDGLVEFMRGLRSDGTRSFSMDLNPGLKQVTLRLPTGAMSTAVLPTAIAWHCVEVGVNADTGVAKLWVNGVQRAELNTAAAELVTTSVRLGGFFKEHSLTGEYHLDEWVVRENYIGPVRVVARGSFMDDPAHWLVIYNTSSADSCAWAEHYRQQRNIPHMNLCGLMLPTTEVISPAEYAAMDAAINDYLQRHGLSEQVKGLLLGFGVPGYVTYAGVLEPTTGLLQKAGAMPGAEVNPRYQATGFTRFSANELGVQRLTARMDRATLAQAMAQVDRAVALSVEGLGDGESAGLWLEPMVSPPAPPEVQHWVSELLTWSDSVDRQRTRLPMQVPTTGSCWSQLEEDGFYFGVQPGVPSQANGYFSESSAARVLFMAVSLQSPTGTTLRQSEVDEWCGVALAAGYVAAVATSLTVAAADWPSAGTIMAGLQQGATLAEAWSAGCPRLRGAMFLVGDPLMTIGFPQAGWNVYGPMARAVDVHENRLIAVLRENEKGLVLPTGEPTVMAAPVMGELYRLQHTDEQGVKDQGVYVRVVRDAQGKAVVQPTTPVWPDGEGWPVTLEEGGVCLRLWWEEPVREASSLVIELETEDEQSGREVVAQRSMMSGGRVVEVKRDWPVQMLRYRWRLAVKRNEGGVESKAEVWVSHWSMRVQPRETSEPTIVLQGLEVMP